MINNDLLHQLPKRPPWQPQRLTFDGRLKVMNLLSDLAEFLQAQSLKAANAGDRDGALRLNRFQIRVMQVLSDHLSQVGKG